MENSISEFFIKLTDPRKDRKKLYPLEEILLVGLCTIISAGESFFDMVLYGNNKLEMLRKIHPFKNGIPSEDTFARVFSLLNPKVFQECFLEWVENLQESTGKRIAIDGKVARRTHSRKQSALHMVSALAIDEGLVLAQESLQEGQNEIPVIRDLLELLDLKGAIVTVDAIGCQKEICERIVGKKGNYILALKDNQKTLNKAVKAVFKGEKQPRYQKLVFDEYEITEKGHGRIESRKYKVVDVEGLPIDIADWTGLKSLVEVESTRETKNKKTTHKRYYISSLAADAQEHSYSIRGHWAIENSLHWVLDVVFREDDSRIRNKNAPKNMTLLRHLAINLIKKDKSKGSIKGKRKAAGWNDDFLLSILLNT